MRVQAVRHGQLKNERRAARRLCRATRQIERRRRANSGHQQAGGAEHMLALDLAEILARNVRLDELQSFVKQLRER